LKLALAQVELYKSLMPNQRAKSKVYLGGYVDKKLHARIVQLAKRAGMGDNKFGFVTQLLVEAIKRRKRSKPSKAPPAAK
jgi:hypothetical protein